jgi:hypothetical protein
VGSIVPAKYRSDSANDNGIARDSKFLLFTFRTDTNLLDMVGMVLVSVQRKDVYNEGNATTCETED